MKRVFSGIISQFTQAISKIFGVKKSKESRKETKGLSSGDKSVDGDANEVGKFSVSYLKNRLSLFEESLVNRIGRPNADFVFYCLGQFLGVICSIAILLLIRKIQML